MRNCYPILAVVAAATLLLNISTASAQDAARGRRGGTGALANMTEEQQTALREMNQETREQSQKVAQARTELNGAIYADKVDEAAIKSKAAALAKAEEELSVARAKAFAKVRSKFTTEQIDALKQSGARGGGAGGGARRRGAQ